MATRTRKAASKSKPGSTSQDEHPLNTIFNLAALLRVNYPADAEQYRKAGELLQSVRQDNVGPKFIHNAQHARQELRELCMGWRSDLGRLALLVLQHLPAVAMQHPVLDAAPRHWHDLPAKEWGGLLTALRAVEVAAVQEGNAKPQANDIPKFLGNGKVAVGTQTYSLEGGKADVLETIVRHKSLTSDELGIKSGRSTAARLLKNICRDFPALAPFIRLPGAKGKGGFSTSIIDARTGAQVSST